MSVNDITFRMNVTGNAVPTINNATAAVGRLNKQINQSGSVMRKHAQITSQQSKNYKFLRGAAQQLGFQLGDYAVQVANGTSKMQAFGQQGAQMLGVFGPVGALLGAAVAVFSAVGVAASKSGREIKDLGSALGVLQEPLTQVKDAVVSMKDAFGSVFPILVNNIDTALIAAGLFAGFMAAKYVKSLLFASGATLNLATMIDTLRVRQALAAMEGKKLSIAMVGLQTATLYATAAVKALGAVLMRLLPVALLVGAAKLIEMFLQLRRGAGSFGQALVLLKDVAVDMFNRISMRGERMYLGLSAGIKGFEKAFINGLIPIAEKFDEFANLLVSKWNQMFAADIFEPLQLDLGFNVKDQLAQASSEISTEIDTINGRIKEIDTALSEPSDAMNKLTQAFRNGATEVSIFGAKTEEAASGGSKALEEMKDRMKSVADTIQSSLTSGFMSIIDGTKKAKDAFRDMARSIIAKLYEVLVVQRIVGGFGYDSKGNLQSSGLVGLLMGGIQGLAGAKATGGPVTAGKAYMVGEKGPEIMVPGRNGNIIPNHKVGGGGQPVQIVYQFQGGVTEADLGRAIPLLVERTKREVVDAVQRGGSIARTFR